MADSSTPRKWVWAAIAVGAVVALAISLWAARAMSGGGFAAPSGLTSKANPGYVTVSWNKVSGAASYVVMRDGVAAYSGAASTFDDLVASDTPVNDLLDAGPRSYTVQAVSADGAVSEFSDPVTVTASRSWAEYWNDVSLLGSFLPATPQATGWNDMTCGPVVGAAAADVTSDPKGTGHPGLRFGVACNVPGNASLKVLGWFASSPDVLNATWADKTKGGQPVPWASGSGVAVRRAGGSNYLYLRFSDPKLASVMIAVWSPGPGALSTTELAAQANTISIG